MKINLIFLLLLFLVYINSSSEAEMLLEKIKKIYVNDNFPFLNRLELYLSRWDYPMDKIRKKYIIDKQTEYDMQAIKDHRSTKEMLFVDDKIIIQTLHHRDSEILEQIIKGELNLDIPSYTLNRTAYIYPNIQTLRKVLPKLILSHNQLREYDDIKKIIAFEPKEIYLIDKPICIPTMVLLHVKNSSKKRIMINGVKSDLYQATIFILNQNNDKNSNNYINEDSSYPKRLNSNEIITFQIIILPDFIREIKGSIYLDVVIDYIQSVVVYPLIINGIANIYQIKPFYYPNWHPFKILSVPIQLYNPHDAILKIDEIVNSFSSVNLVWANGKELSHISTNNKFTLEAKTGKTIMYLNFFKEVSGIEYGLLQLKTDKDTLIIPVLINVEPIKLKSYPHYLNFGKIIVQKESVLRVIPLQLFNGSKKTITLKAVYLRYDDQAIDFISNENIDECILFPNESKKIGHMILNPHKIPLQIDLDEDKIITGKIYLETSDDIDQFTVITYEYLISANEFKYIKDSKLLSLEELNAKLMITKKLFNLKSLDEGLLKNIAVYEHGNNVLYEYKLSKKNYFKLKFYIKNIKDFLHENNHYYYLPFYSNEKYYSMIPITFTDHLIDGIHCLQDLKPNQCLMTGNYNKYKSINAQIDEKTIIQLELPEITWNEDYATLFIFANDNAKPVQLEFNYNTKMLVIEFSSRKQAKVIPVDNMITMIPYSKLNMLIKINSSTPGPITENLLINFSTKTQTELVIKTTAREGILLFNPNILQFNLLSSMNYLKEQSISVLSTYKTNKYINEFKSKDQRIKIKTINDSLETNNNTTIVNVTIDNVYYDTRLDKNELLFTKNRFLSFRELYLWKVLKEKKTSLSFNTSLQIVFSDKTISIPIQANLSSINLLQVSSETIDFGKVQLRTTHQTYINITNKANVSIIIQPMLSFSNYFNSNIMVSDAEFKLKPYEQTNNEFSIFYCFFQNTTKKEGIFGNYAPGQFEQFLHEIHKKHSKADSVLSKTLFDLTNAIIINQDLSNADHDTIYRDKMIEYLYDNAQHLLRNSFKLSKRILCKTSFVSKEEFLLKNSKEMLELAFLKDINSEIESIKLLSQNAYNETNEIYYNESLMNNTNNVSSKKNWLINMILSFYKRKQNNGSDKNKAMSNQSLIIKNQEVFLSHKDSGIYTLKPNETITYGPIIYHPKTISSINATLLIKNNLTVITPIDITGSSGIGIAKFLSDEPEPYEISSQYTIYITKELYTQSINGKIIKQILLVNTGNMPLNYRQISLEDNKCEGNGITLLTCGSLYLKPSQTKILQFSIEINFDFIFQLQTIILKSSDGIDKTIKITVVLNNNVLSLKHHFFTLCVDNGRVFSLILFSCMIIVIILSMKQGCNDNKDMKRKLKIHSNLSKVDQCYDEIQQQNLFIKAFRRFDHTFYEQVQIKMDEERIEYVIDENRRKKPKENIKQASIINKQENIINKDQLQKKPKTKKPKVKPQTNITGLNDIKEAKEEKVQHQQEKQLDKGKDEIIKEPTNKAPIQVKPQEIKQQLQGVIQSKQIQKDKKKRTPLNDTNVYHFNYSQKLKNEYHPQDYNYQSYYPQNYEKPQSINQSNHDISECDNDIIDPSKLISQYQAEEDMINQFKLSNPNDYPMSEVNANKVQDTNEIIKNFQSFNPAFDFNNFTTIPHSSDPNEYNYDLFNALSKDQNEDIDNEDDENEDDSDNKTKSPHYISFNPHTFNNIFNSNGKIEEENQVAIDSGNETFKLNFQSIFGSNSMKIPMSFDTNANERQDDNDNDTDKDTSKSYFKCFNSLNQFVYSNPFSQKQSNILTDLYESDEEDNEEHDDNDANSEQKENKTQVKDKKNQACNDNDIEDDEKSIEWDKDDFGDKTQGYFDQGHYILK